MRGSLLVCLLPVPVHALTRAHALALVHMLAFTPTWPWPSSCALCCGSLQSASAWLVQLLGHMAKPGSAFPVTPSRSSERGSVGSPVAGQQPQERAFVGGLGRGGDWRGRGWLSVADPSLLGEAGRGLWRPPCAHAAQCERVLGGSWAPDTGCTSLGSRGAGRNHATQRGPGTPRAAGVAPRQCQRGGGVSPGRPRGQSHPTVSKLAEPPCGAGSHKRLVPVESGSDSTLWGAGADLCGAGRCLPPSDGAGLAWSLFLPRVWGCELVVAGPALCCSGQWPVSLPSTPTCTLRLCLALQGPCPLVATSCVHYGVRWQREGLGLGSRGGRGVTPSPRYPGPCCGCCCTDCEWNKLETPMRRARAMLTEPRPAPCHDMLRTTLCPGAV